MCICESCEVREELRFAQVECIATFERDLSDLKAREAAWKDKALENAHAAGLVIALRAELSGVKAYATQSVRIAEEKLAEAKRRLENWPTIKVTHVNGVPVPDAPLVIEVTQASLDQYQAEAARIVAEAEQSRVRLGEAERLVSFMDAGIKEAAALIRAYGLTSKAAALRDWLAVYGPGATPDVCTFTNAGYECGLQAGHPGPHAVTFAGGDAETKDQP